MYSIYRKSTASSFITSNITCLSISLSPSLAASFSLPHSIIVPFYDAFASLCSRISYTHPLYNFWISFALFPFRFFSFLSFVKCFVCSFSGIDWVFGAHTTSQLVECHKILYHLLYYSLSIVTFDSKQRNKYLLLWTTKVLSLLWFLTHRCVGCVCFFFMFHSIRVCSPLRLIGLFWPFIIFFSLSLVGRFRFVMLEFLTCGRENVWKTKIYWSCAEAKQRVINIILLRCYGYIFVCECEQYYWYHRNTSLFYPVPKHCFI